MQGANLIWELDSYSPKGSCIEFPLTWLCPWVVLPGHLYCPETQALPCRVGGEGSLRVPIGQTGLDRSRNFPTTESWIAL